MAKATLKSKFDLLPKAARGSSILDRMNAKGKQVFAEVVSLYVAALHKPSLSDIEKLLLEETGVKVSRHTFLRYVREHGQNKE